MHKVSILLTAILMILAHQLAWAGVTIIAPNTIIDHDTTYKKTTLDLTNGSFIILNNAKLIIENSKVIGNVSPSNTNLISLNTGKLILNNNIFTLTATSISENPNLPSLYYALKIVQGEVVIIGNKFSINKSFTVGLFSTDVMPTNNIIFKNNNIHNFHGGLLIRNSKHSQIVDNTFSRVSGSNIFILEGSDHTIEANTILFPGNNNVGDGIDISDTDKVMLKNNYIYSGSCYSLVIYHSSNLLIDNNIIIGGITYAIYITVTNTFAGLYHDFYARLNRTAGLKNTPNHNLVVRNNYFSQNRFGLAASDVDNLIVMNNIFTQHFADKFARKFWTNNDVLLHRVTQLNWANNLYKEAYSQSDSTNMPISAKFVEFPVHGGVVLT